MAEIIGQVRVTIVNEDAVQAFADAVALIDDVAADCPWRQELTEALAKLKVAAEGMEIEVVETEDESGS